MRKQAIIPYFKVKETEVYISSGDLSQMPCDMLCVDINPIDPLEGILSKQFSVKTNGQYLDMLTFPVAPNIASVVLDRQVQTHNFKHVAFVFDHKKYAIGELVHTALEDAESRKCSVVILPLLRANAFYDASDVAQGEQWLDFNMALFAYCITEETAIKRVYIGVPKPDPVETPQP
ncbi:hypothetical protein C4573_06920 [Candidatus Woesearchaeota archaeon]|nr:MAG: hypothetical protein C4573_06920 [Candidatus Woesearchaeota archaeon]